MKLTAKLTIFLATVVSLFSSFTSTLYAQGVMGGITNPLPKYASTNGEGLFKFLGNVLKFIGTIGGIYMIFQLIMGGFAYINSAGDPKAASAAWSQIWQSILGMVIIASAFVIAAVVERFTGIKILAPVIYGP
ncbi:MAG: hypothetical protein WC851_05215 [Candidatus Shapirobacteria bacterium]|jgi:hypothetical protein